MIDLYHTELDRSRSALYQAYSTIPSPTARRADGGWSAVEILRHLYLSEYGIAKVYRVVQRVCTQHPPADDESLLAERERITRKLGNVEKKVNAPDTIQPQREGEPLVPETCITDLNTSRSILMEHSGKLSDEVLRTHSFPHPFLGDLTLYGWLWFVSQHEIRHTHQMEGLRQTTE